MISLFTTSLSTLALSLLAGLAYGPAASLHGGVAPPPPPVWNGPTDGPGPKAPSGPGAGGGPTTPGPAGPATGGPAGPSAVGGLSGLMPTTAGPGEFESTAWSLWWTFNDDPYLELKAHVHAGTPGTGGEAWFLGIGDKRDGKDSARPTQAQIQDIVPALLAALEVETNNDIVTSCLIALAKIGESRTDDGAPRLAPVIERFLTDKNQEISETAAVALGILASPESVQVLADLLRNSPRGRELVGRSEVNYRTRAFAAYGLGLVGARYPGTVAGERIVVLLHQAIEKDDTASADLKVACIHAMGLVPLDDITRLAQIDYLLSLLGNEKLAALVRAHCPVALARLFPGMSDGRHEIHRQRIATELIRLATAESGPAEVVQGSVQALGLLGTNDGEDPLDLRIRKVLKGYFRDQQAQRFALVALAKVGARAGKAQPEVGVLEVATHLLEQLAKGRGDIRAWAGLSCGILARGLADAGYSLPVIASLQQSVRLALQDERDPSGRGALAISLGIMGFKEAAPLLLGLLDEERGDEARGHIAVALGLMDAREALLRINRIIDESRYRPELLRRTSIALGLLGDKDAVPKLVGLLADARSLATQASISSALGFIGDQRSIEPLVVMLRNSQLTERARAFAAVALGLVGDKESLPWNSKIAQDIDYRAATATLTDPKAGAGILDIL